MEIWSVQDSTDEDFRVEAPEIKRKLRVATASKKALEQTLRDYGAAAVAPFDEWKQPDAAVGVPLIGRLLTDGAKLVIVDHRYSHSRMHEEVRDLKPKL